MQQINTCSKCPAQWTGLNRAHCSVCHETFSVISTFDMHRRDGECKDPKSLGLINRDGIWGHPSPDKDLREVFSETED